MPKSIKTPQSTTTRTRARKPRTTTKTSPVLSLNHAESSLNGGVSSLNHSDIAHRAYELFLSSGAMHGRDLEHWLQAESELRDRFVTAGH
jgi:hypothetical protein